MCFRWRARILKWVQYCFCINDEKNCNMSVYTPIYVFFFLLCIVGKKFSKTFCSCPSKYFFCFYIYKNKNVPSLLLWCIYRWIPAHPSRPEQDRKCNVSVCLCVRVWGRELVHLHWPTFTHWEVEPPIFLCLHLIPPCHPKDTATLQYWVKKRGLPILTFSSVCGCVHLDIMSDKSFSFLHSSLMLAFISEIDRIIFFYIHFKGVGYFDF